MKKIIYCVLLFLVFFVTANTLFAEEEAGGKKSPEEVAKEYVAKKHNCDIDDLTISHAMIGRAGAHIDVNYGYDTVKVQLKRKDFESDWEVESSKPAHEY